jgi:hypothetical protein
LNKGAFSTFVLYRPVTGRLIYFPCQLSPNIEDNTVSQLSANSGQRFVRSGGISHRFRKPQTTSSPSSSVSASVGKNQSKPVLHNPNSVANIQRQLDPLAFDPTVKKLTNSIPID